jgi:biopolymer transport protein ExbB
MLRPILPFLVALGCFTASFTLRAQEPAAPAPTMTEPAAPAKPTEPSAAAPAAAGKPAIAPATEPQSETRRGFSIVERLAQGGSTVVILLVLSIVGFTSLLDRLLRLQRKAIVPPEVSQHARALWSAGKFTELRQYCAGRTDTLSKVIESFARHRHCQASELSQIAGDIAGRDLRGHLQRAYPLAVVATLAPLLGLLGTVVGMIESFEVVSIAGSLGDASLLAGGISKALVTTAVGLSIAVPFLGAYHYFRSRTNSFAMELEGEVNELVATWFSTARYRPPPQTRRRGKPYENRSPRRRSNRSANGSAHRLRLPAPYLFPRGHHIEEGGS